jgi:hypothetical protein
MTECRLDNTWEVKRDINDGDVKSNEEEVDDDDDDDDDITINAKSKDRPRNKREVSHLKVTMMMIVMRI